MSEGENHSFQVTLQRTREDYRAFIRAFRGGYSRAQRLYYRGGLIAVICLSVLFVTSIVQSDMSPIVGYDDTGIGYIKSDVLPLIGFAYILVYICLIILFQCGRVERHLSEAFKDGGNFLIEKTLRIDEQGVHETSALGDTFIRWEGVTDIQYTATFLLLYVDRPQAYIIPLRSFANKEQGKRFYLAALRYWASHAWKKETQV